MPLLVMKAAMVPVMGSSGARPVPVTLIAASLLPGSRSTSTSP